MRLKKLKNLIENQLRILKEQNEDCNNNVYIVISYDNYNAGFSYSYNELVSYMNTGDSGEYGTHFIIEIGNQGFSMDLPNIGLGVNTEDYGISNKNDLLNIVADQNSLSLTLPDLGFGDVGTIFWSSGGGSLSGDINEISLESVQDMVTMCSKGAEGCEGLINQSEHLGCCAKCDDPNFNPEEDPTCAPHCECCEDNYMRYTCSLQGTCISGPNSNYPFETLEECENSGCGEDAGKAPFKDKPKPINEQVKKRIQKLAGIE